MAAEKTKTTSTRSSPKDQRIEKPDEIGTILDQDLPPLLSSLGIDPSIIDEIHIMEPIYRELKQR